MAAVETPRLRDRLASRWRARALDDALASGATPDADPLLAVRARTLVQACTREDLALALRRLVHDARHEPPGIHARAPLARAGIVEAETELRRLASRLQAVGAVEPQGVAQIRLLLSDGTGPLYDVAARQDLRAIARSALAALTPRAAG